MKSIFNWMKKHIVAMWIVISVIFAFIVHVVFSISAPTAWLVAKWSAGEILGYIATVSLSLLAIWQNNRFKEENDISQERLERITAQANELATINKIIEIESNRLERLRKAFDEFYNVCNPYTFVKAFVKTNGLISDKDSILVAIVDIERRIDVVFLALSRELRIDNKLKEKEKDPLKIAYRKYYLEAKDFLKNVKNNPMGDYGSLLSQLCKTRDEFIKQREDYLISKEKNLHQVIYGNLSLQEIKSIYCDDL